MKRLVYFLGLAIISLSFFLSCEIGLGEAVDTKSPEVEISFPVVDSIIRDSFVIKGTWSDDGEIEAVEIKLSKTDGYKEYGPFYADVQVDENSDGLVKTGTWSCVFNPQNTIIDGTYEANITIKDKVGHYGTYVRQFSIDNTAPVLILQKPFTKVDAADSNTFEYGQHFSFEGQVSDENNVKQVDISIYRDPALTDFIKTITLQDVSSTISIDVATFTEGETNDYSDIYGYTSVAQAELENKLSAVRYCKVTTYDKAQRYSVDGVQTEEDLYGNKTTAYYIYDDVNTAELLGKYKITDFYKMKNGNYNLDNANRSVEEINSVLSVLESKKSEASKFKLNPKNNPTFSVSGKAAFTGSFEINTSSTITNKSTVVVDIKPGLDNYTIQKESLRPYILPCDNNGKLLVEDIPANRIYLSEAGECDKNGSSYKCSVVLSTGLHSQAFDGNYLNTNSLLISSYYLFGMEGSDIMGKQIISNGLYAFKFESNDTLNTLSVQTSLDNKTWESSDIIYAKADTVIYVKGVATGSEPGISGLVSVKLNEKTTNANLTINVAERTLVDGYYKQPFTAALKVSDFALENDESYILEMSAGTPSTDVKPIVKFDNEAPAVIIGEPSPYDIIHKEKYAANEKAETQYLNQKVSLNVNISDNDSVKSAKVEFKQKDSSGNWVAKPELTRTIDSGFANWSLKDIDTTILNDNSLVKISVTAVDRSGNEKVYDSAEFMVYQESDRPTAVNGDQSVSTLTTRADFTNKEFGINVRSTGGTLSFVLYDDDGIKEASITMYKEDELKTVICSNKIEAAEGESNKKENFNLRIITDSEEGISSGVYPFKLIIKDINDVSNEYLFYARIISPAPILRMETFDEEVSKITTNKNTEAEPQNISSDAKTKLCKKINITSKGGPFKIYRKVNNAEDYELVKENWEKNEYTDEISFSTEMNSGEYTLEYRVLDIDDQEGTVKTTFYVDNDKPVIDENSIVVPDVYATASPTGDFSVSVKEKTNEDGSIEKYQSGVKTVQYKIIDDKSNNSSDVKEFSYENDWTAKVVYSELPVFAEEGPKKLAVRAIDEVGNLTNWVEKSFTYDKANPEAEVLTFFEIDENDKEKTEHIVSSDNYYGYKFTLKLRASDSYALNESEPIKIIQEKKGLLEDYTDAIKTEITDFVKVEEISGIIKIQNLPRKNEPANPDDIFAGTEGGSERDKAEEGTYRYTVTVTDKVGKTKISNPVTMTIDYEAPTITLTKPAYTENSVVDVNGVTYSFEATATDNGAAGVKTIYYAFDNQAYTENNSASMSVRKSIGSGRSGSGFDLYEGTHEIHLYAIDKAGNKSKTLTQKFDIDKSAPEIENIRWGISSEYATSTSVTLEGSITETNKLSSFKIYKTSDWETAGASATPVYTFTIGSAEGNIPETPNNSEWKCDLTGLVEGENKFTLVAVDVKNKQTAVSKTIKVDTGKPTVDLTNVTIPSVVDTGNNYYTVTGAVGSATDTGYGVEHIYLGFSDDTADAPVDVDILSTENSKLTKHDDGSWSSTIEFASLSTFVNVDSEGNKTPKQGNKKIWLKAKDVAGNECNWISAPFVYDVSYPELSETGVGTDNLYKNSTFSLFGNVYDSYGIKFVKIIRKVSLQAQPADWPTGYYKDEKCTIAASAYANDDYYTYQTPTNVAERTWSQLYTLENGKSGSGNSLADGTYTFTILVEDLAGKQTQVTRIVKVDTTSPEITSVESKNSDSTNGEEVNSNTWYKSRTIALTVKASDNLSDIAAVSYKNGDSWSDMIKQADGSYKGNVTFERDTDKSYTPKISFRITDGAGNVVGDTTSYKEQIFNIDTTPPVISNVYDDLGNVLSGEVLINGSNAASTIDLYIEASDANVGIMGISSGESYVDSSATKTVETEGVNKDRYKVSVPKASGDVKLTISDKLGNKETYKPITLKVDNRDPTIEVKAPATLTNLNGYIEISAVIKDFLETGSTTEDGTLRSIDVSYSIDGTNYYKIEDEAGDEKVTNIVTGNESDFIYSTSARENISIIHRFSSPTKLLAVDNGKLKLKDAEYSASENKAVYVKIKASDQARRSCEKVIKLEISRDSDRPTIDFTNITLGSSMADGSNVWLENTTVLQGVVTDDDGITELQLSLDGTTYKPAALSNTNWTFDVQDLYEEPVNGTHSIAAEKKANGNQTIYFKTTDKEGNVFTSKDAVAFDAVKISDGTNTYGIDTKADSRLYVKPETVPPEVIINSARININGTETYDTAFSKLSVGGENHKFDVKFMATDENLIKAESVTAEAVCIPDGTTTSCYSVTGTVKAYKTVNNNPAEISDFSSREIEYFIASFTVDSDSIKNDSTQGRKKAGEVEISITAKDQYNRESTQKQKIKYDYECPTITFAEPLSNIITSGSVSAYGETSETTKIWYALSLSDTTKPSTNTEITTWTGKKSDALGTSTSGTAKITPAYKEVSGIGVTSWFLYFDGVTSANAIHDKQLLDFVKEAKVTNSDSKECTDENIRNQNFTEIVNVYLWIKAEDAVGNITETPHKIQVDSQGDRPSVEIAYPRLDDITVGGEVNIYGSAEPKNNNLMKYVWLQLVSTDHVDGINNSTFAKDGKTFGKTGKNADEPFSITKDDLDYLKAAGYNVYNMKKYDPNNPGASVWSSSLKTGEKAEDYGILIETEGSTGWSIKINSKNEFDISGAVNPVGICVYAQDAAGNRSLRATKYVNFDSSSPIIKEIFVKQYDTDGNETASRKYEDGMWLSGKWYLTFTVTDDNKVASVSVGTHNITDFESDSSDKIKKVKYKITESVLNNVIISAEDDSNNTSRETITINFDNTPPRISNSTSGFAKTVQNSNGYYSMSSMVEENDNESGVDYVAFYFKRDNKVYDVMLPQMDSSDDTNYKTVNDEGTQGLYWHSVKITNSTPSSITVQNAVKYAHVGGLVKINGTIYKIGNVNDPDNPTVITIKGTLDSNVTYNDKNADFALANVVDNPLRESATDTAKQIEKKYGYGYETAPLNDDNDRMIEYLAKDGNWTASINSKNIPDGAIELHIVAFDKAGNCSEKIIPAYSAEEPDGLFVSNNAPRLAGAKISIDYNGNGTFDIANDEVKTTYTAANISTLSVTSTSGTKNIYDPDVKNRRNELNPLSDTLNVGSSTKAFAVLKGKTEIEPEIVGGNGAIYYAYTWKKYNDSTATLSGNNPTAIIEAGSTDYTIDTVKNPVTIQVGDLLKAGEATNTAQPDHLELRFYDSTNGSTSFDDNNQYATMNLYVGVNVQSASTPSATISPLYWDSLDNNSIVKEQNANTGKTELKGHIELSGDYTTTQREGWGTGLTDSDDKVSGEIIIEGTAEDSGRIIGLYFAIDGMNLSDITDKQTVESVDYYNLTQLENNVLTGNAGLYDTYGVKVEIDNDYTEEKHTVNWKLIWNTEKVSDTRNLIVYNTKTDVKLRVLALNQGTPSCEGKKESDEDYSNLGLDGETYYPAVTYPNGVQGVAKFNNTETKYLQVDVVPYVTGLETQLTSADPDNPSVYGRSALGSYPVYYYSTHRPGKNTENEKIVVKGYNLNNGKVYFNHDGDTDVTADLDKVDGEFVITVNKAATPKVYNLPSGAKTGSFSVKTGTIEALNNKNSNDARGRWTAAPASGKLGDYSIYKGYYNRQPNDMNNDLLTDDLDITIWDLNAQAVAVSSAITRPVFHINPQNGKLGFAFSNGDKFYLPNGTNSSYTYWSRAWNAFNSIGFTFDPSGKAFGVEMGTDSNGVVCSKFRIVSSIWGDTGTGGHEYSNKNCFRLESHNGNAERYDYQPKLVATNTTSNDKTYSNVYLMYYDPDSYTVDNGTFNLVPNGNELKLRCGTIEHNKSLSSTGYNAGDPDRSTANTTDNQYGDFYDAASTYGKNATNYTYCSVVVNKNSTYKPGTNYSLAVIPAGTNSATTDTLVTVWVDPVSDTLVYGYMENPLVNNHKKKNADNTLSDSTDNTPNNMWNLTALDSGNAGGYCAIAADNNGGIHIAYYSKEKNGSLKYIYKSSYNATSSTSCTVDSYGATGKYLTIDFAKEGTENAAKYIPYIGYYTSMKKPKYAYLKNTSAYSDSGVDSNSMFNGNWEVMCIPTMSSIDAMDNIQIGIYRNNDGTRKTISSQTGTNNVGGNGTNNPVLAYATSYIGNGYVETAQIK